MDTHDQVTNASAELATRRQSPGIKQKQNKAAYERRRQEQKQVCIWLSDAAYTRLRNIADTLKSPISTVAEVSIHNCLRSFDDSTIADYAQLRRLMESIPNNSVPARARSKIFHVYSEAMSMGMSEVRSAHSIAIHEHHEKAERDIAVNRRTSSSESTDKNGDSPKSEMAPDHDVSYLGAELFGEE